jgi:tripartite-type tricarboxylate transporter receptor subunit TctC
MIGDGPFLVVVHPSLPVKTVKELIAFAKARPGTLNYASSGAGGITHLITEVFAANAGLKLVHVPYKSVAPAVVDVVGGHVPMLIVSVPSVLPQVKAGRLRALAVTSPARSKFVPELPTVAEAGVPGYEARQWWGMFAQGRTPRTVVGRLNGELQKILAAEDVKARLADEGAEPVLQMTPEAFAATCQDRHREVAQGRPGSEHQGRLTSAGDISGNWQGNSPERERIAVLPIQHGLPCPFSASPSHD